jgi:chromosome segregation protein
MFRLEKLEIAGFKSFYDPANLSFPAPMTAVVGPNGCGKSNICDAIIWVLGENRAAHIRGETMEDVIFQGSARRRPLSMGEVTLTLKTENGHPAADDGLDALLAGVEGLSDEEIEALLAAGTGEDGNG